MAQSTRSLVGRDAELASLISLLGVTPHSPGVARRHVLLAGDAGVGKTRLLTELRDRAVADGWQVYAGHCLDLGESALSYLPFSEILDRLVAGLPDIVEQVATAYPALARLQPVRRMIGWRGSADADTPDRANLFEAVHSLLEAVSEKAPTLVVIEDVHWADQSTRDLLSFLFTRPFTGPVALVASYRSDDLHRRHPLRQQVAEWTRLSSVERLSLAPLDDDSVRTLVEELDAGLPNAERETIVKRAEGNAFFVEELVGAARDEHVPDNLADVLLVRLDRLDETARRVVRTASVSGRRVGHDLLESVAGVPAADLEVALRSAVELNILVPVDERYRFRHALLAEAVYDDLLPGERVRLHARYAAVLQDKPGLGTAAELAWHAREAHDLPVALAASVRAGGDAMAVGGPDEAAEHYQTALALAADPATRAAVDVDVTKLTVRAVDALMMAGRIGRAATLAAEQLDRLPEDAPASERARLLAARAEALLALESGTEPLDVSAEAVETLPDDAPASVRAVVLAIRARVLAGYDYVEEAQAAGLDALDVAERHDLHTAASDAIMTLSGLGREGPKDPLRASLQEAIDRAHSAGAIDAEMRGRYHLARSYEDWAEWDEAIRWFRSAVDLAARHGIPWAPYGLEARWQLLWVYVLLGRWDEAVELSVVSSRTQPRVLQAMLDSVRLRIDQARGADVTRETRALRRYWEAEGTIPVNAVTLEIEAAVRTGDPAAVVRVYDDAVASLGTTWHPWFSARIRFAALTAAGVARLLPTTPAADWAALASRVNELHDDGDTVLTQYSGHWGIEGRAWMKRLEAETLRVRWLAGVDPPSAEALLETWAECERIFAEFGDVLELAIVRTARATVLRALGDLAGSRAVADLARESAHALGAEPLLDDLKSLGSTPVRHGPESTALTPRETEILTLVADGRTNGEIAKQLFISTKTVSVHVSNILGKLSAAGRTEAAAIGRRRGLIG